MKKKEKKFPVILKNEIKQECNQKIRPQLGIEQYWNDQANQIFWNPFFILFYTNYFS